MSRNALFVVLVVGLSVGVAWVGWTPISIGAWNQSTGIEVQEDAHADDDHDHDHESNHSHSHESDPKQFESVGLSEQAIQNLRIIAAPAMPTTYWRALEINGTVIDRPGVSDRGVVSQVSGIITKIHHYPGDTVEPKQPLFTIRLVSESLNLSQIELFKASRDIQIAREQRERLSRATESGSLSQSRVIEIENQLRRLETTVIAYRQDLQMRGLTAQSIDQVEQGNFLTEYTIYAPDSTSAQESEFKLTSTRRQPAEPPFAFQLQSLEVKLGQQVQAGQVLAFLADHRSLLLEGRAFTDDLPWIQFAAMNLLPIEVQFPKNELIGWQPLESMKIQHVANIIDTESRTFSFFIPLQNQWKVYTQDERQRLVWRFRPGDRVRMRVPVEKMENVFVLHPSSVVRDGIDTFVFQKIDTLFVRLPVHVVSEDREHVVIANDGVMRPGVALAQSSAASLNRALKANQATGGEEEAHVHADGTTHAKK